MKRLFIMFLFVILIVGCTDIDNALISQDKYRYPSKENKPELCIDKVYYAPNNCEYYIFDNYHGGIPVHKEDCKACELRKSKKLTE